MGSIIYNGISSETIGLKIWSPPDYEIPERDIEEYHVPGRSGNLIVDYGSFKNVERSYTVSCGDDDSEFLDLAKDIIVWTSTATTYARLEDTYEPDYYRMAMPPKMGSIRNLLGQAAMAQLAFNCKPQRYLKTGETTVSFTPTGTVIAGSITNPTNFTAKPLIKIYGSSGGTGNTSFNGVPIAISSLMGTNTPIVIDCELQDCYSGATNVNSSVTLSSGFPVLEPGSTTITIAGSITKIEVIPRWWTI